MYIVFEDHLSFAALARAWAIEPGTLAERDMVQRLLAAYWLGEFDELRVSGRHVDWPDRQSTRAALGFCGGLPTDALSDLGRDHLDFADLASFPISDYPPQGQAILEAVQLPRDMIAAWCLAKAIPKPVFWFGGRKKRRELPGRPSSMHLIENQMELRAKQGRLASTLGQETHELADWAEKHLPPQEPRPQPRTIGNRLRSRYHQLKSIASISASDEKHASCV
jgi:hypothetical protein